MEPLNTAQLALRLAFALAVVVWGWNTPSTQQLVTGIAGGLLLMVAVKPHSRLAAVLDALAISVLQVYAALWLPLSAWAIGVHRRYARSVAFLLLPAPFIHAWQANSDFVWWAVLFGVTWLYLGFTLADPHTTDDVDEQLLLPLPDELREQWEQEREAHRQLRFQYQELVTAHRDQATQRQTERCRQQILQNALTAREPQDAARQMVSIVREYTDARNGALWFYDSHRSCLQLAYSSDAQTPPAVIDTPSTRNLKGTRLFQTATDRLREALQTARPAIAVLLHDEEHIAGAIALFEWGSSDESVVRERLSHLRDALVLALRRLQEHHALEQENRMLSALYEVSRLLLENPSVQDLGEKFVLLVAKLLPAPCVTLYLRDAESDAFTVAASAGEPIRLADDQQASTEGDFADWVAQRGEPVFIASTSAEPGLIRSASKRIFASLMGIPLSVRGKVEAVLAVAHPKPGYFDHHHLEMLTAVAGQFQQVLEVSRLTRSVGLLALTDGLTGLFNRRYLELRLDEEVRRSHRYGKCFSLLLADVDHFKRINDTWGHATGDLVLQEVARRLLENLREIELVFRYGGEEFLVILPETPLQQAAHVAQRLRLAVEQHPFRTVNGSKLFRVTLSVGVAEFPTHGADKLSLLASADRALYVAKEQGRNRVEVLPPAA